MGILFTALTIMFSNIFMSFWQGWMGRS